MRCAHTSGCKNLVSQGMEEDYKRCGFCDKFFCDSHLSREKHDCPSLRDDESNKKRKTQPISNNNSTHEYADLEQNSSSYFLFQQESDFLGTTERTEIEDLKEKQPSSPNAISLIQNNVFNSSELRLGVATWNVAHFGKIDGNPDQKHEQLFRRCQTAAANFTEAWNEVVKDFKKAADAIQMLDNSRSVNSIDKKKGIILSSIQMFGQHRKDTSYYLEKFLKKQKRAGHSPANLSPLCDCITQPTQTTQTSENEPRRSGRVGKETQFFGRATKANIKSSDLDDTAVRQIEVAMSNLEQTKIAVSSKFGDAKTAYDNLNKEVHKRKITDHIIKLFENNSWLDILVLQEVGEGIDYLKVEVQKAGLKLYSGPRMKSGHNKKNGQREFYPIILREGPKIKKYERCWAIGTDGEPRRDERGNPDDYSKIDWINTKDKFIDWEKRENEYRPIIVHDLQVKVGAKPPLTVHIGVVHTTPGNLPGQSEDYEFQRENEHKQICQGLKQIGRDGSYWIIGGDYYLSREARVINPASFNNVNEKTQFDKAVNMEFQKVWNRIKECFNKHGQPRTAFEKSLYLKAVDLSGKIDKTVWEDELEKAIISEYQNLEDYLKQNELEDYLKQDKNPPSVKQKYQFLLSILQPSQSRSYLQKNTGIQSAQEDAVRNILELTFEKQLPSHLAFAQTVSGTNWHDRETLEEDIPVDTNPKGCSIKRAKFFATARIADFFIYTKNWQKVNVGLMTPFGRVIAVDTEYLQYTRYWRRISDHFPVGGLFSIDQYDRKVENIRLTYPCKIEDARQHQKDRVLNKLRILKDIASTQEGKENIESVIDNYMEIYTKFSLDGGVLQAISEFEDHLGLPDSRRMTRISTSPIDLHNYINIEPEDIEDFLWLI